MIRSIVLLICLTAASIASADVFPRINAEDLNGRAVMLPDELPSDPSLVLFAFRQGQQDDLNTWINGMALDQTYADRWVELPVISRNWRFMKSVIDNGMRSGIQLTSARARTITLFTDPRKFMEYLGETDRSTVYVMVISQRGEVLYKTDGLYAPEAAKEIAAVMGN